MQLLSVPMNALSVRALAEQPLSLTDLRREVGAPPQTTLRSHLKALAEAGVVERREAPGFPGPVGYELTAAGRGLVMVADLLELWLEGSPQGPVALHHPSAKGTIKALSEAWSTKLARAIAARPLALTELTRLIQTMNYPSLERRLGALRLAGLVERCPGAGRGTPYGPTRWMRRAVGPLTAAASWERLYAGGTGVAFGRIDIETAFLLGIPLVHLDDDANGVCRLAVEVASDARSGMVGVTVKIADGKVVGCVARLEGQASCWVSGSVGGWEMATLSGDLEGLEVGGDAQLGFALLHGLHEEVRLRGSSPAKEPRHELMQ